MTIGHWYPRKQAVCALQEIVLVIPVLLCLLKIPSIRSRLITVKQLVNNTITDVLIAVGFW